jgi:plastocyanin
MAEPLETRAGFADQPTGLLASTLTRRSLLRFMVASVGIAAAGSLLAACGGDDDDDDDSGSGTTPTSAGAAAATDEPDDEPTEEMVADEATEEMVVDEPTEEPEDEDDATAMTGDGGGETHTIDMAAEFVFDPAELTINVGDTVTWVVVGEFPHSTTCDPAKAADPAHAVLPEGAEPWDSGILQTDQEFSHTFDVAGEYSYFCIPHESMGMLGKLTVEA